MMSEKKLQSSMGGSLHVNSGCFAELVGGYGFGSGFLLVVSVCVIKGIRDNNLCFKYRPLLLQTLAKTSQKSLLAPL